MFSEDFTQCVYDATINISPFSLCDSPLCSRHPALSAPDEDRPQVRTFF